MSTTTDPVIASMVLRGDLSGLTTAERSAHYVQMCESLGLNPHSQPFAYLKLNGKEVLYATRGATDQLAAIHKLTREIVDGPKVIDLAGTKLVYAVCKVTLPGGRYETSTATVPLIDPVNVLMKCETKAKRRATLSILGLGLLDEMELETIPAAAQSPGSPVDLSTVPERVALPSEPPPRAEPSPTTEELLDAPAAAPADTPPVLEAFYERLGDIELPGESVAVWMRYRADLAPLDASLREGAWKALCRRTEEVGRMKNAKVWLKKAIAEEDARRALPGPPGPDNDPGPGGSAPRRSPSAGPWSSHGGGVAGTGSAAPQAHWEPITTSKNHVITNALEARVHVDGLGPFGVVSSFARHRDHPGYVALCVEAYARMKKVDCDTARYMLNSTLPPETVTATAAPTRAAA